MTPRPAAVRVISSSTLNSGSPKNASAPWASSSTIFRSRTETVGRRHSAVTLKCRFSIVRGQELEHGPEVGEIEQRELLVVTVLEDQGEHAGLRVVEGEHLGEEQRSERADRGSKLDAELSAQADEFHGTAGGSPLASGARRPFGDPLVGLPLASRGRTRRP
jgi:hypothetical protein